MIYFIVGCLVLAVLFAILYEYICFHKYEYHGSIKDQDQCVEWKEYKCKKCQKYKKLKP